MIAKFLDWNEVPSEYKYRAVDGNGRLFYYKQKPVIKSGDDEWRNLGEVDDIYIGIQECENPELTLEERPRPELEKNREILFNTFNGWKVGYVVEDSGKLFIITFGERSIPMEYDPNILEWKYINEIQF